MLTEKIYFSILNKTADACNNGRYLGDWQKPSKDFEEDDLVKSLSAMALMCQPLHIFFEFLKIYMIRLITNWSKEIRNKHILNKINTMIFAKFAFMQKQTNKIVASISSIESIGLSYSQMQMNTIDRLKEMLENLKEYDMEKEVNQLSKFIDGIFINEETRSYFRHKKGRLYRWDLKYKKEDIEELAEDMARHPDWMDDAYS